jgi:uncharacterized protein (TIGR03086 family)
MPDVTTLYRRALERFGQHVHAIREDQWHGPTPCTEWDVRVLVNHLVYENRWIPPLLEGQTIAQVGDRFDGDLLGDDPATAWDQAAKEAERSVMTADLAALVHLSRGDVPGEEYLFEVMSDLAIHGWDLARAIGDDETLDPETVDVLYDQMKPMEQLLKASGAYGPIVEPPPDADRQTQLLAIFGRVA